MKVYSARELIHQTKKDLNSYREYAVRSVFMAFGGLFLLIESFEVVTAEGNVEWPYILFMFAGLLIGLGWFYLDGYLIAGFLKRQVVIKSKHIDTPLIVKFGDLFAEQGWKAIGANDFFDSVVDNNLVSRISLHGHVIEEFWRDNRIDWERQVKAALDGVDADLAERREGNRNRYAIGTTAPVTCEEHKFLFVALTRTSIPDNVTKAGTDDIIVAVRGLLRCARKLCAKEPLVIPLMGSGLARVGIGNAILVDLILAAIVEETKLMKVTDKITVILPEEKAEDINLGAIARDWN